MHFKYKDTEKPQKTQISDIRMIKATSLQILLILKGLCWDVHIETLQSNIMSHLAKCSFRIMTNSYHKLWFVLNSTSACFWSSHNPVV